MCLKSIFSRSIRGGEDFEEGVDEYYFPHTRGILEE